MIKPIYCVYKDEFNNYMISIIRSGMIVNLYKINNDEHWEFSHLKINQIYGCGYKKIYDKNEHNMILYDATLYMSKEFKKICDEEIIKSIIE